MIKENAKQAIRIELEEVNRLLSRIDDSFEAAVRCILDCGGRVVVTGMGKSGHIGKKIAASLASTGTPSFFLHPAEAFHGDLGMVTEKDIVMAISNSGESSELVNILPIIRRIGAKVIALCGNRESSLGEASDYFIDIGVQREAGPLGLAPTASTTTTLVMGDAIVVAVLSERHFTAKDFALYHPGGALGRKLLVEFAKEELVQETEDDDSSDIKEVAEWLEPLLQPYHHVILLADESLLPPPDLRKQHKVLWLVGTGHPEDGFQEDVWYIGGERYRLIRQLYHFYDFSGKFLLLDAEDLYLQGLKNLEQEGILSEAEFYSALMH